ncbi:MAG TPA: hypothetical protein VKA38_05295, partial [Draconibacterium sp.]|nr:hypothetical protein [Draconibacterium sp.]
MAKVFIILLLLLNGFWASAQNHNRISLDGKWEIIFDSENKGVDSEWYLNKNFDQNPAKMQIDVPSCWEVVKKNYEGVAFYRRKFNVPATWKGKILELKFDASNYKTEVWVNDLVVGFHEGGYTPFSFRIDKLVKPGEENSLMVRVVGPIIFTDQRIDGLGKQEVPLWRGAITGGIWQSVNIFFNGTIKLNDVFIQPKIENNLALFNLSVENLNMANSNATVNLKVL